MSEDREERELAASEKFLERVAQGCPEMNAALEVNWTPRKLKQKMADKDFAQLVEYSKEVADGAIEQTLYALAQRGNFQAIQLWLYNRQSTKWRDVKRIEIHQDTSVSVTVVNGAVEAAKRLLVEQGPASVQSFHRKAIEAHAHEEV